MMLSIPPSLSKMLLCPQFGLISQLALVARMSHITLFLCPSNFWEASASQRVYCLDQALLVSCVTAWAQMP